MTNIVQGMTNDEGWNRFALSSHMIQAYIVNISNITATYETCQE